MPPPKIHKKNFKKTKRNQTKRKKRESAKTWRGNLSQTCSPSCQPFIPMAALRQRQYLFVPIPGIPQWSGRLVPGPEDVYMCVIMCTCAYLQICMWKATFRQKVPVWMLSQGTSCSLSGKALFIPNRRQNKSLHPRKAHV